jgi:hypothetical protein
MADGVGNCLLPVWVSGSEDPLQWLQLCHSLPLCGHRVWEGGRRCSCHCVRLYRQGDSLIGPDLFPQVQRSLYLVAGQWVRTTAGEGGVLCAAEEAGPLAKEHRWPLRLRELVIRNGNYSPAATRGLILPMSHTLLVLPSSPEPHLIHSSWLLNREPRWACPASSLQDRKQAMKTVTFLLTGTGCW